MNLRRHILGALLSVSLGCGADRPTAQLTEDASPTELPRGDAATHDDSDGRAPTGPSQRDAATAERDAGPRETGPDSGPDEAPGPFPIDYGDLRTDNMPAEDWKETRWVDPSGWTTLDVTEHGLPANDPSLDASQKITEILAGTSGRRRLFFPAGTYTFKSSLTISVGDLWIDGEGADQTVFRIDAPGELDAQLMLTGAVDANAIDVMGSVNVGDDAIMLADTSSLAVGDMVQLFADDAPLAQGGDAWSLQMYAQMLRVTAIEGPLVRFDMKVLLPYLAAYHPRVRRHAALKNLKVSSLKLHRAREPATEGVSNIIFRYTDNALIEGVESSFSGRNHIYFWGSKDCVIRNNYVHDCFKPTTNGYGYGLSLVTTTGCLITNNKTSRLRHEVTLQVGANHNVVSYNDIAVPTHYNDVALHATYAYMNLFEGNVFLESYADSSKDGQAVEATTGPGNTWFRNYATGRVGSAQTNTRAQNVVGNLVGSVVAWGSGHHVGANLPLSQGNPDWGDLSEGANIPASLYLHEKPTFFGASDPWPVFGPSVSEWGIHNALPAHAPRPQGAITVVENAGFEAGTLDGWKAGAPSPFSVTNERSRGGEYALKLVGAGAWANVQQVVPVRPNTRYTWSVWGQSSSDGGRITVLAGSSTLCTLKTVARAGSEAFDWHPYYCQFDSGNNTTVRLYLGDGGGTHYFDDSQLY